MMGAITRADQGGSGAPWAGEGLMAAKPSRRRGALGLCLALAALVVSPAVSASATSVATQSGRPIASAQPAPTLSSVHPDSGPVTGGTQLWLYGTGFDPNATVTVGGLPCSNMTWTQASVMSCSVPPHDYGAVSVSVTNPDGQNATLAAAFTYVEVTVYSVTPDSGPVAGGTRVTVNGLGFAAGSTASFGGSSCSDVVVVDPTTLTCTTSAHVVGDADVVVTNPDGQSGFADKAFTYLSPPQLWSVAPVYGLVSGGSTITIYGSYFDPSATVLVGGASCTNVTWQSANSLTCSVAPHTIGWTDIVVSNGDGQEAVLTRAFSYTTDAFPGLHDVTLSGPAHANGTLQASPHGVVGAPTPRITFTWQRLVGSKWVAQSRASSSTLLLSRLDVGHAVRVIVTVANKWGVARQTARLSGRVLR